MRGLMTAVIGMGVLIVVGSTVLVVLMLQRMSSAPPPNASAVVAGPAMVATIDEPEGAHIAGVALAGDRLAVQLGGGGPDRVVVLDTRTGHVVMRAALAR